MISIRMVDECYAAAFGTHKGLESQKKYKKKKEGKYFPSHRPMPAF